MFKDPEVQKAARAVLTGLDDLLDMVDEYELASGPTHLIDVGDGGYIMTEREHKATHACYSVDGMRALMALLADLTDPDDCTYDHHGYCQAHMWFQVDPPCPHARAKQILAAHIRNA